MILITGAAGFIGMQLCKKFLEKNIKVLGVDNENNYYDIKLKGARINLLKSSFGSQFSYIKGDLNDYQTWDQISKSNIKFVIHLAAQAGVRYSIENPMAYIESNILAFQKVIDFLISKNIKKFFYASSSSVYGNYSKIPFSEDERCNKPESYYASTKIANELMAHAYLRTHNVSSLGMRFFTVYGPWGRPDMAPFLFVKSAYEDRKINVFNNGHQRRDFTYIDDVTEAIFLLYKKRDEICGHQLINIGNGSPTNLLDFITIIEKETGKKFIKKFLDAQKGDVKLTYADTSKLNTIINYKPKTSINDGVKKFVFWYKKYYSFNTVALFLNSILLTFDKI